MVRNLIGFNIPEVFRKKSVVDKMVPPAPVITANFIGVVNFKEIGFRFLEHFIDVGGLQRSDRVLDVGCGIGRMAIPLTQYLDNAASYEGFDVVPGGIDWCQKQINRRYRNFRFQLANVKNNMYSKAGKFDASSYQFPYEDRSFDFVFLTSVFTHLLPKEMEKYLSEIYRVLKTGKNCFITYFLINDESLELMRNGSSKLKFVLKNSAGYYTINHETPEAAVAYEEDYISDCFKRKKLEIMHPIRYGYWCGRSRNECLDYQDIIIATKV